MSEPQAAGDAAFWQIYDSTLPTVYGFLVRRTDESSAEDLTQEVFARAARSHRDGSAEITLPWLLTVARSRLVDHYRAEQRRDRKLSMVGSMQEGEAVPSAEASAEARRLAPATEVALRSLPGAQRAALVMHHLDDLSVAEVASALGRSVRATESLLARARRSFAAAIEGAT